MADGSLLFDTKLDSSGITKGLSNIGSMVTKSVAAIGAGLTVAGGAAIKMGSEFETSFAKASTLFGDVSVDTDNLNKKILEMSSVSGTAASELNETLYQAMSAGIPVTEDMSEALGAVDTANKLSVGGYTSAATAMGALTTAINAYKLPASDAARISDELITVQNKGVTTVDELASNMGKAIATGSAYNINLENINAGYIALTKSGISTAESTTYMSSMFNELGDSGSEVGRIIREKTGMSFSELMESGGSLADAMDILSDSVNGDSSALINLWGSAEAGKAANAICQQGTDAFRQSLDDLASSAGSTQAAYNTMMDTFEGKAGVLKQNAANLGIAIYEGLQEQAKGMVDVANGYVQTLSDAFRTGGTTGLVNALGSVIANMVAEVAQFLPQMIPIAFQLIQALVDGIVENRNFILNGLSEIVLTFVSGIATYLPSIVESGIVLLTSFISGIGEAIPEIVPVVIELVEKIAQAIIDNIPLIEDAAAQILVGIGTALGDISPILRPVSDLFLFLADNLGKVEDVAMTLTIAIGSLFAAWKTAELMSFIQQSGGVVAALTRMKIGFEGLTIAKLKDKAETVALTLMYAKDFVTSCAQSVAALAKQAVQFGITTAAKVADKVANAALTAGTWLLNAAQTALNLVMSMNPIALIVIAIMALVAAFIYLWNTSDGFRQFWIDLWNTISSALSTAWEAVSSFFTETIPEAFNSLVETISSIWSSIVEFFTTGWNNIVAFFTESIPAFVTSVVTWLQELPNNIAYIIGYIIGSVIQFGIDIVNWIATNVPMFVNTIVTFISELPGKVWNWLVTTFTNVVTWGADMIAKAIEVGTNFVQNIITFISELPGKIWDWLVNAFNQVVTWASNMIAKAIETGQNFVQNLINFIQTLPEKIWNWLLQVIQKAIAWKTDMLNKAKEAGENFVKNVIDFIKNLPSKIQEWFTNVITNAATFVTDMGNKATEAGKGFFDNIVTALSELPGKMGEIGSNIVSGIWQGISNGWGWLVGQVQSLANSLFQGAKDALGIHSPSRKFKWIGQMCVEGMDEPLRDYNPYDTLQKSMRGNAGTLSMSMLAGLKSGSYNKTTRNETNQTFNIYQPVKTPSELMRAARLEQQYGLAGE